MTKQTVISAERVAEIIAALNDYEGAVHDPYDAWQDVILRLSEYDGAATETADPTCMNDQIVLLDGTVIRWDYPTQRWAAR